MQTSKLKIRLCFSLLLCFFSIEIIHGRSVDSLLQVVESENSDTAVIGAYGDLFIALIDTNPDEAYKHAISGLNLAEKSKREKSKARFLNNIGMYFYKKGNHSMAMDYYNRSLECKLKMGDKSGAAKSYVNIGNLCFEDGLLSDAENCFLKALEIFDELENKQGAAYCMNNLGAVFDEQKYYAKSIDYYLNSKRLKAELSDTAGVVRCCINIGIAFQKTGDFRNAEKSFFFADSLSKILADNELELLVNYNFAELFLEKNEFRKSEKYFSLALLQHNGQNIIDLENIYSGLIKSYVGLGDYKNAYNYQEEFLYLIDSIAKLREQNKLSAATGALKISNADLIRGNESLSSQIFVAKIFSGLLVLLIVILLVIIFAIRRKKRG